MSKLLVVEQQKWYSELSVISSYYEKQYETYFRQCIDHIFEDFHTISFKLDMSWNGKVHRPDILVLKKDYSEWWIIEAELISHTEAHILKQVETFKKGSFSTWWKVARYVVAKAKDEIDVDLDEEKVYELITNEEPEVLVVLDQHFPGLKEKLDDIGVKLCLFEIYKAVGPTLSFRISGEYPLSIVDESPCSYVDSIGSTLKVHEGHFLDDYDDYEEFEEEEDGDDEGEGLIGITYNGKLTKWRIIKKDDELYLTFNGAVNPMPPNHDYILFKDTLDQFHIKVN